MLENNAIVQQRDEAVAEGQLLRLPRDRGARQLDGRLLAQALGDHGRLVDEGHVELRT